MTRLCYTAISTSASAVYTSGLPFCPSISKPREVYTQDLDGRITIPVGLPTRWSAHVTTMEGHTSEVRGVDYSPDSKRVVTGCQDRTIRLWDAHTGGENLVLKQEHIRKKVRWPLHPRGGYVALCNPSAGFIVLRSHQSMPLRPLRRGSNL